MLPILTYNVYFIIDIFDSKITPSFGFVFQVASRIPKSCFGVVALSCIESASTVPPAVQEYDLRWKTVSDFETFEGRARIVCNAIEDLEASFVDGFDELLHRLVAFPARVTAEFPLDEIEIHQRVA